MPLPPEDPPAGVPDWVLTYGDMMSLLLCFFILLAAMSEMKTDDKTHAIIASIMEQFADEEQLEAFRANSMKEGQAYDSVKHKDPSNRKRAETGGRGSPGSKRKVETIRDGNRTTIGGSLLFEPGGATLSSEAKEQLRLVADSIKGKRHMIEVKGYEPPAAAVGVDPARDPMDLAFARARAVIDFLTAECGLRRDLIRACVAAPVESTALPWVEGSEAPYDRVTVSTTEATRRDYERAHLPAGASP